MTRKDKIKKDMLKEINNVIGFKILNLKEKTISKLEKQVLFETLGFQNLINYSSMPIVEIKKHWDKSSLAYM